MNYIVFDLEFNQDLSSLQDRSLIRESSLEEQSKRSLSKYPFEIIQIGAVKLDSNLNTLGTFDRYIKPTIYSRVSPFITELTQITTEQLLPEEDFTKVYQAFLDFSDTTDSISCVWGMSDLKALYKNVQYHQLNTELFPKLFIDLQPYASTYFKLPQKKLLRLQTAVELLEIPLHYEFHNALHDAHYTAEIFKKIYNTSIQPKIYNPSYIVFRPRQPRKAVDYNKLIQQFEKMYARPMSEEEQSMIKLAYNMGKTHQFIR